MNTALYDRMAGGKLPYVCLCNRCNAVLERPGKCPQCGCPEYRMEEMPWRQKELFHAVAAAEKASKT